MADDHLTPVPRDPSAELARREPATATEEHGPMDLRPPATVTPEEVHGFRFRMAYALLAVLLGAAVGAFIVLVGRSDNSTGAQWSFWKPTGHNDFENARQIATFVGDQYRLPSGRELVAVIPHFPPEVQGSSQQVPIKHIALVEGNKDNEISVDSADNSIEYILCGIGGRSSQNCAITEGQPTLERGRLLHRESLELALYSFKYLDVDSVVTLLPPRPDVQNPPTYALYFKKSDFKDALSRPMTQTLPGAAPFSTATFTPFEQAEVGRLVTPHLFQYQYQQAPDGSALLVLSPIPV